MISETSILVFGIFSDASNADIKMAVLHQFIVCPVTFYRPRCPSRCPTNSVKVRVNKGRYRVKDKGLLAISVYTIG